MLITGGAGFVGSSLALAFRAERPGLDIVAFDNLHRRGSELSLARLAAAGIGFHHGDIRVAADLLAVGPFDLLIECSAEPSVHAGYGGDPSYLLDTNLVGTIHCLDAARRARAAVVFMSTSRVYSIAALRALPLAPAPTRLVASAAAAIPGWSAAGVAETFPTTAPRSLYGTTKLASELLVEEYGAAFDLPVVINRCGVIAGPWQLGRVDQGFVALWCARHLFGGTLSYSGFGGVGLQVRDIVHVADLHRLIAWQIDHLDRVAGRTLNAGGGLANSVSLRELTALCAERTDRGIAIGSDPETRTADIPYYVTDNAAITALTGWSPQRSVDVIVDDTIAWLRAHERALRPLLG